MRKTFSDMMGREVTINYPPKRIVSLVPSQTELLYDLGLEEEVVGITKFCVHPEHWYRNKTRVGGTKQLNIDRIRELAPDLIIANKEENEKEQVEALAGHYPVWISDIRTLEEALTMIRSVGQFVSKADDADTLATSIKNGFERLQRAGKQRRVAYFIWYKPWMTVGTDTFINNMIEAVGWENVMKDHTRYPEVSLDELKALAPQLILLSSEPFPFKEKHVAELKQELPDAEVKLVDGEMFSWYGSRMLKALPYFGKLLSAE
jgi:ABC-type Fe3+-hydroxamate transport system substrate-binding protein